MSGKRYFYNTPNHGEREISVQELEHDFYAVCYHDDQGKQKRIYTSNLPGSSLPGVVQRALDQFASKRGLKEAFDQTV